MSDSIDWSDPCARANALQAAYYGLLSGQREIEIRTRTIDVEDFVRFQAVDIEKLKIELQSAQRECARACGMPDPNRRFAITAGGRSDMPSYNRQRRS